MTNRKRLVHILIVLTAGLFILIGRLAQIQLFDTLSFSHHQVNLVEESVKQRVHSIAVDDGRGKLLDRYGNRIQDVEQPALILFPFLSGETSTLEKVSGVLDMPVNEIEAKLDGRSKPLVLTADSITEQTVEEINDMQIPGVYGQMLTPEHPSGFAAHFIGAVRENPSLVLERYPERVEKGVITKTTPIGIRGIQKAFDPFLVSEGDSKLIYHVERSGRPLFGLEVKYKAPSNPFYPVNLTTTLDQDKQVILERAVVDAGIEKGGAVLLDVKTSDVLAMVSQPLFPRSDPLQEGTENQMIIPQNPGSVFKIVTATAAIERNLQLGDRRFDCDQNVYQDGPADRQLGMLTFEQSFYQSCNATFAELLNEMVTTDENVLEQAAEKLGLTQYSGWSGDVFHLDDFRHFPDERKNTLWLSGKDKHVKRAVAQTAIGQLNVRLSPLSVANMMATIARGGEKKEVRAAQSVEYKNGATLVEFDEHQLEGDKLSKYTSKKLRSLLEGVVQQPKGTGHHSFARLPWQVAGKSGTAEKGDSTEHNKWFAGYFPADHPRYALVVVDLQASSSQSKTNQAFASIVQKLYEADSSE